MPLNKTNQPLNMRHPFLEAIVLGPDRWQAALAAEAAIFLLARQPAVLPDEFSQFPEVGQ